MTTVSGLEGLKGISGQGIGESEWLEITQDRINKFADATGDHQWIHVDEAKAKAGPFGKTIAHGYLTLSLLPMLTSGLLKVQGVKMGINYGLNKLRYPAPVPVGSRVRALVRNLSVEEVGGGAAQVINEVTIQVEGQEKPSLVAETLTRYYF